MRKLTCNEIRRLDSVDTCPEANLFLNAAFATCMDSNLYLRLQNEETQAKKQNLIFNKYNEYKSAYNALVKQMTVTLNAFTNLKGARDCAPLIERGAFKKTIQLMNEAGRIANLTSTSLGVLEPEPVGGFGDR